ncbi:MAG: diguanylate cyclase [Pelovirga sp.]
MKNIADKALTRFFFNLVLIFIGFLGAVYLGIFLNNRQAIEQELLSRARAIVETVVFARNWNARHGSVFVEKSPGMAANPYLENPDIETVDGRVLTRKNPALMVREISEMIGEDGAFQFHMASLTPINPNNAPDKFETAALHAFEDGVSEVFTREHQQQGTYFRYMVPLIVEPSCLECHAQQGYRNGDVRGGISVRFNVDAEESLHSRNLTLIIALALVSFAALFAIIYRLFNRLSRQLKAAGDKLLHIAITDELTGLRNRRYLMERLRAELKQLRRTSRPLACIMFDLDHFKQVNDTHGHEVGDRILQEVAAAARQQCRESDILSRFGGEEFVVVLPDTTLAGAMAIAERLRQAVAACRVTLAQGESVSVTASFGVTWMEELQQEVAAAATTLLRQVDDALYAAKEQGRNRIADSN